MTGKKRKKYLRYKEKQESMKRKRMERYGSWMNFECQICGGNLFFFHRYDADCCIFCDVWYTSDCKDPNCPYCAARPSAPSEALYYEELFLPERKNIDKKDWLRRNYQHKKDGEHKHQQRREYIAYYNTFK